MITHYATSVASSEIREAVYFYRWFWKLDPFGGGGAGGAGGGEKSKVPLWDNVASLLDS